MSNFVVVGNPIKHSMSPVIHKIFAEQTGIKCTYSAYKVCKNTFFSFLSSFFLSNGLGMNVTLPFKHDAFLFSDVLTKRAQLSQSVNTLKKLSNGIILGDNTDGEGLLYDLKRLNYVQPQDNILLLGSGGAAYSIVGVLLSLNCSIFVYNRTVSKAYDLVSRFSEYGDIQVIKWDLLETISFNLIINATSAGLLGDILELPNKLINSKVFCYDLFYDSSLTPFLVWCKQQGANYVHDGIGMLVSQAAESFFLWHGVYPSIESTIMKLDKL